MKTKCKQIVSSIILMIDKFFYDVDPAQWITLFFAIAVGLVWLLAQIDGPLKPVLPEAVNHSWVYYLCLYLYDFVRFYIIIMGFIFIGWMMTNGWKQLSSWAKKV